MKSAVVIFPGSNRDRDMIAALEKVTGSRPAIVWHADSDMPPADLIVLPGGFSYGDYLRSGAIAARAPVMRTVAERAEAGVPVLGICNGFQILCEAGLLPGVLMRNASLRFICREVHLSVETTDTLFTGRYAERPGAALPGRPRRRQLPLRRGDIGAPHATRTVSPSATSMPRASATPPATRTVPSTISPASSMSAATCLA